MSIDKQQVAKDNLESIRDGFESWLAGSKPEQGLWMARSVVERWARQLDAALEVFVGPQDETLPNETPVDNDNSVCTCGMLTVRHRIWEHRSLFERGYYHGNDRREVD